MKQKTANLNHGQLSYIDEGSGETMVLLHGFCGSHLYWEDMISELATSYRVIAPDLRGHGQSSVSDSACAVEDLSEDIKDLLDHLGIDKVTMFGHSLGGYVTLAFADHQGNRLNRFALIHSTAFPDDESGRKGRDRSIAQIKEEGIRPVIDTLIPKLFKENTPLTDKVARAQEIGYKTPPEGAINALVTMKNRPNRNDVLQKAKIPVLLLAGENDRVIPAEKVFSVSGSHVTQEVLTNSGHMGMYEAPEKMIEIMKSFMKKQ